jgi:hypothetical protein
MAGISGDTQASLAAVTAPDRFELGTVIGS